MQIGRTRLQVYEDFSIFINPSEVRIRSVGGASSGMLRLSLRRDEVQRALDLASQTTRGYATRGIESKQWDPIRDIGMQLFSALFEGARMTAFQSSQNRASNEGNSLRLRLYIEDPNLEPLPWEFMHDGTSFLGLSPRFSIVRTVTARGPLTSTKIDSPIRVVLVTSSPVSMMDKWLDRVIPRLTELGTTGPLSPTVIKNPTVIELANALRAQRIHVFHYFGETGKWRDEKQAMLWLMDEGGRPVPVGADRLRTLLMQNLDLRLVYLSAQHSEGLAEELAYTLPAVIGIRGEACDEAISAFTEGLYRGMLASLSLEEAVTQARQEIDRRSPGSREWGLPVFYLQTPDSVFLTEPEDLSITVSQTIQTISPDATTTDAVIKNLEGFSPEQVREWKKLRALLNIQQKNLEALQKRHAALGPEAPPYDSEIEFTNKEIENLTKRLDQIQGKVKQ